MLFVSITIIIFTLGLSFVVVFVYILFVAVTAKCNKVRADHIVILGKKLVNNRPDKSYRLRLNRVLVIAIDKPGVCIYILGGVTGDSLVSESKAGRCYLEDRGVQAENISIEEKSRDTLDNMKQFKVSALTQENRIVIITNRYHLARASIMAKSFGFSVECCAAENSFSPNIVEVFVVFSEAFFLHWYLSGRSYAKLTHNQRMLARIQ